MVSFLSPEGNELLERARAGVREGKVEPELVFDIETVLLDGDESANKTIADELAQRGC